MAMHCVLQSLLKQNVCKTFGKHIRLLSKAPKYKVGDELPDITVYESSPTNHFSIRDVFKEKKGILFSVVGAFMPGCKSHIPEYLKFYADFKEEGYSTVACISVNDPFVMEGWGRIVDPDGKIRMLADMKCEFAKELNYDLDATELLGNVRSKRFAMLIDDNKITHISNEPDNTGLACLLCIQQMKN